MESLGTRRGARLRRVRVDARQMEWLDPGLDEVRKTQNAPEGAFLASRLRQDYLAAALLPNFLRNLSTRPPMSVTDFWVPV